MAVRIKGPAAVQLLQSTSQPNRQITHLLLLHIVQRATVDTRQLQRLFKNALDCCPGHKTCIMHCLKLYQWTPISSALKNAYAGVWLYSAALQPSSPAVTTKSTTTLTRAAAGCCCGVHGRSSCHLGCRSHLSLLPACQMQPGHWTPAAAGRGHRTAAKTKHKTL